MFSNQSYFFASFAGLIHTWPWTRTDAEDFCARIVFDWTHSTKHSNIYRFTPRHPSTQLFATYGQTEVCTLPKATLSSSKLCRGNTEHVTDRPSPVSTRPSGRSLFHQQAYSPLDHLIARMSQRWDYLPPLSRIFIICLSYTIYMVCLKSLE